MLDLFNSEFGYHMTSGSLLASQQLKLATPWHAHIFTCIKKDLKNEHLKVNKSFYYTHFGAKILRQLTADDLMQVYSKVVQEGNEPLAEFIINRWIIRHLSIYTFFEVHLKGIHPHIEEIRHIDASVAQEIVTDAKMRFAACDLYLFCLFNSVQFSPEIFEQLRTCALNETTTSGALAAT